jgi:hypothetical protein
MIHPANYRLYSVCMFVQSSANGNKPNTPLTPAQWITTDLDFPVDNTDSYERCVTPPDV